MFAWVIGETVINAMLVPHDGILVPLGSVGEKTVGGTSFGFEPLMSPPAQAAASVKTKIAGTVTKTDEMVEGFRALRIASY
ncbi:MAG: hypothetical protein ABJB66_01760 [Gemmatimonadaceae bacterium]